MNCNLLVGFHNSSSQNLVIHYINLISQITIYQQYTHMKRSMHHLVMNPFASKSGNVLQLYARIP